MEKHLGRSAGPPDLVRCCIGKEFIWPRGRRSLYIRDPAGNVVEPVTPGV
jgi:hypothetical protein